MTPTPFKPGFSLTEVLMAAGILLVGFLLIAGTFPVGVKLTAVATERTIGVVASEEAMAKIHLYGIDNPALLPSDRHIPYDGVSVAQYRAQSSFISSSAYRQLKNRYSGIDTLNPVTNTFPAFTTYFQYESLYPSTAFFDYSASDPASSQIRTDTEDPQRYVWSALCRRLDSNTTEIQVTIFVCRMAGQGAQYPLYNFNRRTGAPLANPWTTNPYPTPVPVMLQTVGNPIGLTVNNLVAPIPDTTSPYFYATLSFADKQYSPQERAIVGRYLTKGSVLLEDLTGRMMRVLEVVVPDPANPADLGTIRLMRMPDSDGNPKSIEMADVDGLLRVEQAAGTPTDIYVRQMWVIPPAQAAAVAGGATPPKVAGRNPCVGVFQGQL
jgi:hypothetical protein